MRYIHIHTLPLRITDKSYISYAWQSESVQQSVLICRVDIRALCIPKRLRCRLTVKHAHCCRIGNIQISIDTRANYIWHMHSTRDTVPSCYRRSGNTSKRTPAKFDTFPFGFCIQSCATLTNRRFQNELAISARTLRKKLICINQINCKFQPDYRAHWPAGGDPVRPPRICERNELIGYQR